VFAGFVTLVAIGAAMVDDDSDTRQVVKPEPAPLRVPDDVTYEMLLRDSSYVDDNTKIVFSGIVVYAYNHNFDVANSSFGCLENKCVGRYWYNQITVDATPEIDGIRILDNDKVYVVGYLTGLDFRNNPEVTPISIEFLDQRDPDRIEYDENEKQFMMEVGIPP